MVLQIIQLDERWKDGESEHNPPVNLSWHEEREDESEQETRGNSDDNSNLVPRAQR